MKCCTVCDNMYYISINEQNSNLLSYYCRNCGHIDDTIAEEGICILNTQLKKGHQKFNHIINEYTKLDPTLPRIYNVPCPNALCASKTDSASCSSATCENPEVIYMRYDDANLKYLYICTVCDNVWKTDDSV